MAFPKTTLLFAVSIASLACAIPAAKGPASNSIVETRTVTKPKSIDISNNTAMLKKMKDEYGWDITFEDRTTPGPANGGFEVKGGCDQGGCPDLSKAFDMVFTEWNNGGFYAVEYDIRVTDCGQCHSHYAGSGNGGCFNFNGCNRPQTICVDDRNNRGHRIWRDTGDKGCFRMSSIDLGDCGGSHKRLISPEAEVACTW
ncbi:hypothetical protein ONZ45_g12110 [Pleurotus djamor]|nr:hypothetical protein ONZ45_g12110 [Pleurotus djamor]